MKTLHSASLVAALAVFTIDAGAALVTRGPYLQQGSPSAIIVRWRTDTASDSRVRYGTNPANLNLEASVATVTTEHIVRLTGLQPDTKYAYELGSSQGWFTGDANDFFVTSPSPGTPKPTRLWVIGDSGTANANAAAVRNAYLSYAAARPADLWLMLGDNAYQSGTDGEFQAAVFDMYPTILQNKVLWPTRGNHESDFNGTGSTYYNVFSLPTAGEAGGLASGTEAYYSFDYANLHFICLDSQGSSRSPTGPMATWLQNDLAATSQGWIIAFWHHPPYSKGSHDSDTESQLIDMRTNILPILENGGVDLVLCGHSHSYERSFLLDGHYGLSSTLTQQMKVDGGDGRENGTGAYQKPEGLQAHKGAVYTVAGSSGQTSGGALNHPAMYISLNVLGSVILDVVSNRLDAVFLNASGGIGDYFTILKATPTPTPPNAPSGLTATAASDTQINLAWTDNASDEQGFKIERSPDGVNFVEIASVGANVVNGADTGLNPNTTYWYRVRAFNAAGNSPYSNIAQATTQPTPQPPAAPANLAVTFVTNNQIRLAWVDQSNDEQGFKIERSADGVNFTQITSVGADITIFTDSGLTPNTTYWYRVRAYNAAGDSPYSNVAQATTLPPPPQTFTLASLAADDGYLLEGASPGTSSAVADNTGRDGLRVGDERGDRQYKSMLSFDTSVIPDGATILSATLRMKCGRIAGNNPFGLLGVCYVDLKAGNGFNNDAALTSADFQAPADATRVMQMSDPKKAGNWSEGALNAAGLSLVNKTGLTQLRVYFERGTNGDGNKDYMGFYPADNDNPDNRPQLILVIQP